jgi:hypothetical protein
MHASVGGVSEGDPGSERPTGQAAMHQTEIDWTAAKGARPRLVRRMDGLLPRSGGRACSSRGTQPLASFHSSTSMLQRMASASICSCRSADVRGVWFGNQRHESVRTGAQERVGAWLDGIHRIHGAPGMAR